MKQLKLPNVEYFTYTGNETVRDIFMVLGNAVEKRVLSQLCNAGTYGLLFDEVTDVAVMEILITFVHFFSQEIDKVQTNFLSVSNILAQSDSANAETIYNILVDTLKSPNIPTEKLSSFASDGCSVMIGKRSGVAQRLKVGLNKSILSFVAEEVILTPSTEQELKNLTAKYIKALTENIERRFNNSLPVVSAFAIFDPLATPVPNKDGFDEYGKDEIETMANHLYNKKDEAESESALDRAPEECF